MRCLARRSSRPGTGCSRNHSRVRHAWSDPARAPGPAGGMRIAERVPGARLQQERVSEPDPPAAAALAPVLNGAASVMPFHQGRKRLGWPLQEITTASRARVAGRDEQE